MYPAFFFGIVTLIISLIQIFSTLLEPTISAFKNTFKHSKNNKTLFISVVKLGNKVNLIQKSKM